MERVIEVIVLLNKPLNCTSVSLPLFPRELDTLHMSQLRALLPVPVAQPVDGVLSPASTSPRSLRPAGSAEFAGRPDVLRDGCNQCVRHPLGTFRSSHFRILRLSRGGGL